MSPGKDWNRGDTNDLPRPAEIRSICPTKCEADIPTISEFFSISVPTPASPFATCYLPGIETPERECWYINIVAVDKAFFTTRCW